MTKKIFKYKNRDETTVLVNMDMGRLADDMCPNLNCEGSLMKDNFYIVCDSCPFSIFEDYFNKIVAKELGTHGDNDSESELEW